MVIDKRRPAERKLVKPVMLFMFSAFLLLGLKDYHWLPFALAVLVPLGIYITTLLLPRLFPADTLLLAMVNFLCALGILVLYRMDFQRGIGQMINYIIGIGVMILCILYIRYWRRLKASVPVVAVAAMVLMAMPVFFGRERNGAKAWIALFGVSFQPSEIVKLAHLVVLAFLLSRRKIMMAAIFSGISLGLLMLQKDLGTALLYYGITLIMVFCATGSLTILGIGVAGAAGGSMLGYSMFSHVKRRVQIWIDPWMDYRGSGYQIVQSLVAMANGGVWGTGLGLGNARVIPEYATDFIFSVILNEFGVLIGICVVAVYALIFLRGITIAMRSRSKFHTLLALGCASLIALQTFVIIGGNIKLIPLTGVTLPFVSYGGTSLISSLGIVGLLQGVASVNQEDIKEDQMIALIGEDS
ncbi:MAG: FtsW/RodA/SpoVE family cell cycle protein [Christensenellales bacterium]|jgi:cell division protein FtsW (lipid II flippase)